MARKLKFSGSNFREELAKLVDAMRRQVEAGCSGFDPDPAAMAERRRQAAKNFGFFRRIYFPHYTSHGDSVLHTWLDETLPAMVADARGRRLALAAPRGEAKSTVVCLQFVCWCVLTRRKKYICLIADAFEQAATLLEAAKVELEANPRLSMDFATGCGAGRVWNVGVAITAEDVKLQAFGAMKRMRGLRHGPYRPDLALCDDLENDENVKNPKQRDKLESWLRRTVLSLGAADDTLDVVVIGTVLHHDSVLSRLLGNKLWQGKAFRAILQWPERMDLWDRWEETLLNQGEDEAQAFYAVHQADMDAGAVVSWPSARPLVSLMLKRATDGHDAFDSEQQNDPGAGEAAPFASVITFWVDRRADWLFYGAVDPSLGKNGNARDPSAILVGGYCKATGVLDVVEAAIRKRTPDRIIEDVLVYQQQYKCLLWLVEVVQFQEFLRTELVKRATARGINMPARGVTPLTDKVLRIEALQPYFALGRIRVHPGQRTLVEQLKHFPLADHDDGPDALEMLWKGCTAGFGAIGFQRVAQGRGRSMFQEDDDADLD